MKERMKKERTNKERINKERMNKNIAVIVVIFLMVLNLTFYRNDLIAHC